MNQENVIALASALLLLTLAVTDVVITRRFVKRWQAKIQESAEKVVKLTAENHRLEMKLEGCEREKSQLEEKLKKAHEKIAILMVEYNRLNK